MPFETPKCLKTDTISPIEILNPMSSPHFPLSHYIVYPPGLEFFQVTHPLLVSLPPLYQHHHQTYIIPYIPLSTNISFHLLLNQYIFNTTALPVLSLFMEYLQWSHHTHFTSYLINKTKFSFSLSQATHVPVHPTQPLSNPYKKRITALPSLGNSSCGLVHSQTPFQSQVVTICALNTAQPALTLGVYLEMEISGNGNGHSSNMIREDMGWDSKDGPWRQWHLYLHLWKENLGYA